jgi:hypothetical protein
MHLVKHQQGPASQDPGANPRNNVIGRPNIHAPANKDHRDHGRDDLETIANNRRRIQTRNAPAHTEDHRLAVFRRQRPRWLFAPYWVDAHPDHIAATQLVEAARFWAKLTKTDLPGAPHHPERIYNYYCVHLKMAAHPAFILDISAEWEQKLAAIGCYESQFITGRSTEPPVFLDALRDEAAYWGKTIGTLYGEPFTCREPIGLTSMSGLI